MSDQMSEITIHNIRGFKAEVKANSWDGELVGYDVWVEGLKIFVICNDRESAAQRAVHKFESAAF
jgi:hypothetical protein